MQHPVTIQHALISVFYKDGLAPVVETLHQQGIILYSTGGTAAFIEELGIPVRHVEQLTAYPSILGGRVKTLHPRVFGGILARRDEASDRAEMETYSLPSFDLVIVDLYPFEETLRQTSDEAAIIEKIDIGGVSLIRAGAKNYKHVCLVADKSDYATLLEQLQLHPRETYLEERKAYASKAFRVTRHYDNAIARWMGKETTLDCSLMGEAYPLRYGENPHQQAVFHGNLQEVFKQIHGKTLSYNNLVDVEAAMYLMEDIRRLYPLKASIAILKHTNACGVAVGETLVEAYQKALEADPVSAFGGVIISNVEVDFETASRLNELFFEVLIAPGYNPSSLEILQSKKNRILLVHQPMAFPAKQFKSLLNGVLEMDRNVHLTDKLALQYVTNVKPTENELEDLLFAEMVVKHLKSNGIALVKNRQLIGMGTGQTSRVDALRQAIHKATSFGFDTQGAVMASEAFFPFPDCVEIAYEAGILQVIQPGGSVKDQDSIDFCQAHHMCMVLTGIRHFKH